jgi:hypothetical protein
MKGFTRSYWLMAIAIFAVALEVTIVPPTTLADGVTWTTSTSSASVTAGNSVSLTFTLTNSLPLSIVADNLGVIAGPGISGNTSVGLNGAITPTTDPTACFAIAYLTDGSSCMQTVVLTTFNAPGDTDPNPAILPLDIELFYSPYFARQDVFTVNSNPITLAINPPRPTAAPEPGTLVMIGLGLLGAPLLMRKKIAD